MVQADECEHYIRNCNRYGMNVDPSVVITLRTRWGVLQPTKAFCEGSLLPLAGILDQNSYIKCVLRTAWWLCGSCPCADGGCVWGGQENEPVRDWSHKR